MHNNPATAPGICIAALLVALAAQLPADSISAAMKRWRVDDSRNEFFTLFRYTPVTGRGYEDGVGRRDPRSMIRVGQQYYVWYTRISGQLPV